jgi:hypothetical protein
MFFMARATAPIFPGCVVPTRTILTFTCFPARISTTIPAPPGPFRPGTVDQGLVFYRPSRPAPDLSELVLSKITAGIH